MIDLERDHDFVNAILENVSEIVIRLESEKEASGPTMRKTRKAEFDLRH